MQPGSGYYATVYYRATPTAEWTNGAVGPTFAITASPTITVTGPTGPFPGGTFALSTWTTASPIGSGEFAVWVRDGVGACYGGWVVPADGTASYSYLLPLSMPPGAGYYATVYYRPTPTSEWTNGAVGPSFIIN